MSLGLKLPITFILTPIEIIGKFTKPFALAIRLFANMVSGHVVLLALISLIFTFATWILVPIPVAMGLGISLLELFVAFLQAFIFTLLSAVFIGLIREGGH
jgi:F-type H+-transporting ATPase subunit a